MSQRVQTHEVALDIPGHEEVQANRGRCPKPRDWSEYVIVPSGLLALGAGIVGAASSSENIGAFFTVSCFVLSGAFGIAEYKVRQLWVRKSLDEEARDFKGENRDLADKVNDLQECLEHRTEDVKKLQRDVFRYQEENAKLREQTDRLGSETDDLERVVDQLPKRRSDLEHENGDVIITVDRIAKEEKANGSNVMDRLAALDEQRRKEAERHSHAMETHTEV